MANSITRKVSRGITTATIIGGYKVGNGITAAVKGLSIAARNGQRATVTVELLDTAGAVLSAYIELADIPPGDTLIVIGAEQTQFLVAGDQVRVTPTAGTVDVIMAVAELS
jgi:hypothetical protein